MERECWQVKAAVAVAVVTSYLLSGCGSCSKKSEKRDEQAHAEASDETVAAKDVTMDAEFPLHGVVTGVQLIVRDRPHPEGTIVGWLRAGGNIRLRDDATKSPRCGSGWHSIYPVGWVCIGQGISMGEQAPPRDEESVPLEAKPALPYTYWYVKDPLTPEYHRPPTRDEQRAASAFVDRYNALIEEEREEKAAKLLAGELQDDVAPPAVVRRYLDRGFYVTGVATEERASRTFVRTALGRYVKKVQLEERWGSEFHGVELGEDLKLPLAWVVRTSHPRLRRNRDDGSVKWIKDPDAEPIERHTILPGWLKRENVAGDIVHVIDWNQVTEPNGEANAGANAATGEPTKEPQPKIRYLRDWYLAVAEQIKRPKSVPKTSRWVHVSLRNQTLVLYEGDVPVYATLVSTGVSGHETPTGVFAIRRKHTADTMAAIGAGQDDRYSIEDVPWTQYFERSFALHGAFWHSRFGLVKSHGCVNLSPPDARVIFDRLDPAVPEGWFGVSTEETPFHPGWVAVTET